MRPFNEVLICLLAAARAPGAEETAASRLAAVARARAARSRAAEARAGAARAVGANKRAAGRKLLAISEPSSRTPWAMLFVLVKLGAVPGWLFGLVLAPARAVPWPRVARELDYCREQFAILGSAGLLAIGSFLAFVLFSVAFDLSSG